MEIPKKFHKIVYRDKSEKDKSTSHKKPILFGLIGIVLLITLGTVAFFMGSFINKVYNSWDEIKFSYEKTEIVRAVRDDYTTRQVEMEKSLMQREKTSEQKLIDEVVKQLKGEDF